jgi:malonyl-CoA/methylmalonyl-CoA synthetase
MDAQKPFDRCDFAPKHIGPNVLPNFFLFSRLVRLAHKPLLACRDLTFGFTATYTQLLTDVLHLRNTLRQQLHRDIIDAIDNEDEVYVVLLGPAGYEFTVGFLALIALGAIPVPISPDLPVKEATYFATKSSAVGVLTADRCIKLGAGLEHAIHGLGNSNFQSLQIRQHLMQPCMKPEDFQVSSDRYMDLNKSGYVIFTSGTTGPPKGGVKRRGFLYDVAVQFSDQAGIREGDVVLHVLPVHHATGITVTLLPFLWTGGCIEFRSGGFDTAWTWERIRQADLDFFSGVPTIYMRLMQHYEMFLGKTPEASEYARGAKRIRAMLCGTSALPRPLQQKWTALRGGSGILTRYGGTEFGNAFTVTPWLAAKGVPDGSVGTKGPGVDLKLSDGDEGEVLLRTPILFNKYLADEAATRDILDEEGYFKTGDIARKEGDFYFIEGRASVDILKSGGYKISALDIEREILGLDYISEVMVVGVDDDEFGQRVAAAIVPREDIQTSLTLDQLRADLRSSLAGYKMPTLLRVVDEIRKTVSGKVIKKVLVHELFPRDGHPDIQRWNSAQSRSRL